MPKTFGSDEIYLCYADGTMVCTEATDVSIHSYVIFYIIPGIKRYGTAFLYLSQSDPYFS
jgi:hypothetical protein